MRHGFHKPLENDKKKPDTGSFVYHTAYIYRHMNHFLETNINPIKMKWLRAIYIHSHVNKQHRYRCACMNSLHTYGSNARKKICVGGRYGNLKRIKAQDRTVRVTFI